MSLQQPILNSETFQELHRKYRDRLRASLTQLVRNADEAEDIAATAFATAWAKRTTFRGEASAYTWLYSIGKNVARAHYRRARIVQWESIDCPASAEPVTPDLLTETMERSECCLRVREVLRRISAIHQRILVAHFIRGRSVRQIAQRERIPVGTVLSRIFTAKRLLREAWEAAT